MLTYWVCWVHVISLTVLSILVFGAVNPFAEHGPYIDLVDNDQGRGCFYFVQHRPQDFTIAGHPYSNGYPAKFTFITDGKRLSTAQFSASGFGYINCNLKSFQLADTILGNWLSKSGIGKQFRRFQNGNQFG